jgi:hypothetical protein
MTALRIALVALLAAGAVVAALLGDDVRSWRNALTGGDAVYAATPSRASWSPSTRVDGIAEALLGTGDDLRLRQALQLYVDASKVRLRLDNAVEVESARARAQDALERAARGHDRQGASQALTLLGILAFRAAAAGGAQSQVDAAIADFTNALRADTGNEQAAYDLELLLRRIAVHGSRTAPGRGNGFGRGSLNGGGGGQAGNGY